MISNFSVTYERCNELEALRGGTIRYGFVEKDITIREALHAADREIDCASESMGAYASDSDPSQARWVSFEYLEYETGDYLTLSIHFPPQATPATRNRLVALLTR